MRAFGQARRSVWMFSTGFAAGLLLGLAYSASVDHAEGHVSVSFQFPDREQVQVDLTYDEVLRLTEQSYMIDFWIHGVLAKLKLPPEWKSDRMLNCILSKCHPILKEWRPAV